jgi:fatty acid desaturase
MTDASRTQGWAICIGAGALAFIFLLGILSGSYWAIALPVAVIVFFVLGLAAWVGYTIATIQVEPEPDVGPPAGEDESTSPTTG